MPPDATKVDAPPKVDNGPPTEAGPDAFQQAVCDKQPTCKDHNDCPSTESCAQADRIWEYCAAKCGPDPTKGGDCNGKPFFFPNPKDGGKTVICMEDGCSSNLDRSQCPPGTLCFTSIGGIVCGLGGPKKLGEACITMTVADTTTACEVPAMCVPSGLGGNGICRLGCDTWPGGPGTTPCADPSTQECFNNKDFLGYDCGWCCPKGSNCTK